MNPALPIVVVKRRARRRARSAGGVIFIVALTMSVLAAVGMYALRASSLEIRTAGFERQATQTHYLSEYGILGATQAFGGTTAQLYLGMMMAGSSSPMRDTSCSSLAAPFSVAGLSPSALSLACRRMGSTELSNTWGLPAGSMISPYVPLPNTSNVGSLGSAPIQGDFFVELTDPGYVNPPAGYDLSLGFCFVELTTSATGLTQPYLLAANTTALYGGEGLEMSRARITGGPIRCR
jgi:hypothetical protein